MFKPKSKDDARSRFELAWLRLETAVGILILGILVFLWYSSKKTEESNVRRMTVLVAESVRADITTELKFPVGINSSLTQLSRGAGGPPSSELSENDARVYIKHYRSCATIQWLDSSGESQWAVTQAGDEGLVVLNHIAKKEQEALLKRAFDSREASFTRAIPVRVGERLTMTAVPVFKGNDFQGYIVAAFHTRELVHDLLEDVSALGYGISVYENGSELYTVPGANWRDAPQWVETLDVTLPGVVWTLKVYPKPEMLFALRSHEANLVMLLELSMGILVLFAVRLAKTARARARTVQIANERVRASESRLSGILEISPDAIITADRNMRITLFNQGAERMFGYTSEAMLGQHIEVLIPQQFRGSHAQHVARFSHIPKDTLSMCDRRPVFGRRSDGTHFPAEATVSKLDLGTEIVFTAILRDITERVNAREELLRSHEILEARVRERTAELADANYALRDLSTRILTSQDEERRRIARELHDSTAQHLFVLSVDLSNLREGCKDADPEKLQTLARCGELAERSISELRTLSYLLHPPMLEELGLEPALRWFVDGFSKRSHIPTTLDYDPELGRLRSDAEITLFRIIQESLTNVHRHSRSGTASVSLRRDSNTVTLQIADTGIGIKGDTQAANPESMIVPGVGLSGMRERIRHLGGTLEIRDGNPGTVITVKLTASEALSEYPRRTTSSGA